MTWSAGRRFDSVRAGHLLLLVLFAAIAAPSAALASDPAGAGIRLALLPVGQAGSYFDLVMDPGERREMQVVVANDGQEALAVRAYATDVYTIVNGGFGGGLRGSPATGTTTWLDFATEVIELSAARSTTRQFTISVPDDATPGEYITSLVLENDRPLPDVSGLAQIVRQAIAVVVTVPGRREPALAIGSATHRVVAGRSVVSVAVENTGNVRLKPAVAFTLSDDTGTELMASTFQMDSFYARTATTVEVPMAASLAAGGYVVRLTLDADGANATEVAIPFRVTVTTPASTEGGLITEVTDGIRGDGGLLAAAVALIVAVLIAGASGWRLSRQSWRRRREVDRDV